MEAALPPNEAARLAALQLYDVLDSAPELAYDDITQLAAFICDTPVALINLVDDDRQWSKSKVGIEFTQVPRRHSMCAHALLDPTGVTIVPNAAQDPRFADNPMVTSEPNIRFYAGAPLIVPGGDVLGTLCVMDRVPRELSAGMIDALEALARQVVSLLELRRMAGRLKRQASELEQRQVQLEVYQRRLQEMNGVLAQQSTTDPLTSLKNRRAFDALMNGESSRTERSGSPLALAIFDVDQFKAFNDEFGRLAGDEALRQVASIIHSHARTYDHAARYGGEEFAVVLPDTRLDAAKVVAERIRGAIEVFNWPLRPITVSVGVATTTSAQGSMNIVERADKALYLAKSAGRNRVVYAAEEA